LETEITGILFAGGFAAKALAKVYDASDQFKSRFNYFVAVMKLFDFRWCGMWLIRVHMVSARLLRVPLCIFALFVHGIINFSETQ